MKKTFVVGFVLLLCAASSQAQVFFSTDFSAEQGYTDGLLVDQPANGSPQWINANPDVLTDDFTVENGALVIRDVTTGGRWVTIEIPIQKQRFFVSWDWQFVGEPDGIIDVGICLSDNLNFELIDGNPVPNYNEQGSMIRMYNAGLVNVCDGDLNGGASYAASEDFSYQDGKKFTVTMDIDPVEWYYDVYVQKEGEDQILLADNFGFRRLPTFDTDGLNTLVIWDNAVAGTLGSSVILDNFTIYGETAVSEWSLF
jgi:hypothetical protein